MFAPIVDEAARRFGDRTVVSSPDGALTYGELADASSRLAQGLLQQGLGPGDIVALALPSGGDWLVAAVAVNRTGAAFAGISPVLSAKERSGLVKLIRPKLVLATPGMIDGLPLRTDVAVIEPGTRGRALWAESSLRCESCLCDDQSKVGPGGGSPAEGSGGRTGGECREEAGREEADQGEESQGDCDPPRVICFTSGTTGRPKAAMYTDRQLRAIERIDLGPDAENIWDGGAPMLASTQFAHVGMATKFPWYIRRGMTLHVMERWRADDALRLVAQERMPTIGAIAPQLALMLRSPLIDELDLSAVQLVIAGGAASPPSLVREVRNRFDAGYSIRYSSTESGGVGLGTEPFAEDESEWSTVGRPREGIEVRIADEADCEVPTGDVGELQLRSDATMHSYWNDPVSTGEALTDDRWLRTGDLARFDERGRVVLVGRRSEMYIRGGYNVFPSEVEAALGAHPSVRDIVVVPAPDEVMGEVGVALIVPDEDRVPTVEDLRDFGSRYLARHKLPDRIVTIEKVPLTTAQKIDRAAAKELLDRIESRET